MPSKTQSILIGGLVVGLLSTSVLGLINVLCCAGIIIGALTGVWHYTTTYELTIPAGQGVLIGVLSGVVGGIISALLNYVLALVGLDLVSGLVFGVYENFMTPEQMDMMREQMAQQSQGLGVLALSVGQAVLLGAIFGAIGGAIGASVFKRGGDAPGGNSSGGAGGPRAPRGDRPRAGGPQQRRPLEEPERGEPVSSQA